MFAPKDAIQKENTEKGAVLRERMRDLYATVSYDDLLEQYTDLLSKTKASHSYFGEGLNANMFAQIPYILSVNNSLLKTLQNQIITCNIDAAAQDAKKTPGFFTTFKFARSATFDFLTLSSEIPPIPFFLVSWLSLTELLFDKAVEQGTKRGNRSIRVNQVFDGFMVKAEALFKAHFNMYYGKSDEHRIIFTLLRRLAQHAAFHDKGEIKHSSYDRVRVHAFQQLYLIDNNISAKRNAFFDFWVASENKNLNAPAGNMGKVVKESFDALCADLHDPITSLLSKAEQKQYAATLNTRIEHSFGKRASISCISAQWHNTRIQALITGIPALSNHLTRHDLEWIKKLKLYDMDYFKSSNYRHPANLNYVGRNFAALMFAGAIIYLAITVSDEMYHDWKKERAFSFLTLMEVLLVLTLIVLGKHYVIDKVSGYDLFLVPDATVPRLSPQFSESIMKLLQEPPKTEHKISEGITPAFISNTSDFAVEIYNKISHHDKLEPAMCHYLQKNIEKFKQDAEDEKLLTKDDVFRHVIEALEKQFPKETILLEMKDLHKMRSRVN